MPVLRFALLLPLCALASCGAGRTPLRQLPPADATAAATDAPSPMRPDQGPELPPDLSTDLRPEARPDNPPDLPPEPGADRPSDLPADLAVELPQDLGRDLGREQSPDRPQAADIPLPPSPTCTPASEVCNSVDDNCDGVVDNDIAPVPCPNGGFRYCLAGQMSVCPSRCAVCVPGGQRVCFISYCSFWGLQTCASDGQSWSGCVEQRPVPKACAGVASDKKHDRATEQCCVDNGFCCLDEFDLDGDGDKTEMLGRCGDVLCAS